jgi:hypothetical protein
MKKTLFVTCIYNGLDRTILGGRIGRYHHYFNSLKTLLNTNADFVIYTSSSEKHDVENKIKPISETQNVRVLEYDLFSNPFHNYFQEKMNGVKTDRCYEVMHGKYQWIKNHQDEDYDYIYWIDCGLSHGGLFPGKYSDGENGFDSFFKCSLFSPKLVDGLNKNEKLTILVATQERHLMDCQPNPNFYISKPRRITSHVVGGLFGGSIQLINEFTQKYDEYLNEMVGFGGLDREEHLLTLIYDRHSEMFTPMFFTTWHHEYSDMAKYNGPNEIYFYNIFEKLNEQ